MRLLEHGNGRFGGHEFNVTNSIQNHGTIEVADEVENITLSDSLINTGVFRVANSNFTINADAVTNDGLIEASRREGMPNPGQMTINAFTLDGGGEWLARNGATINFHSRRLAGNSENDPLVFNVRDGGVMNFRDNKLQALGATEFQVGTGGTLNLRALNPDEDSDVSFVNHGTINIDGPVFIGGGNSPGEILLPSLVPIDLENTGTIRINDGGSLTFDARIANYAEGGAVFNAGTWELKGDSFRWNNTDESTIPSNIAKAILNINVVGVGDDATLGDVTFEGDPDYSAGDFDTAMRINASNVLLSGAAVFPYFNTIEENRGNIRFEQGMIFETVGSLTSTGDIEVGANSNLVVKGDLFLHGGKVTIEPPIPGASGDLGRYGGRLAVVNRKVEVVGAELNVAPGGISGVSSTFRDERDNALSGDWLIQESSTTNLDGTVDVVPARVNGVAGSRGIEVLTGSVVLDGKDAHFDALSSLRIISGELELTGGNEYRNMAANAEFRWAVPPEVLRVDRGGRILVQHGGAMYAHELKVDGEVVLGPNGSLSLEDVLTTDTRSSSRVEVNGVLHAKRVLIGEQIPNREKNPIRSKATVASRGDVEIQRGVLIPGDEEGLRIYGDLQLSAETISQFVLDNGDAQARLSVDSATLAGSLEVLAASTYDPALDELVELIVLNEDSAEVISGTFDDVSLPTTLSGKAFELSVTELGVFLDPYLLGDFNGDDRRSGTDINLLSTVGRQSGDEHFDLNGDGTVDQADRVVWVEDYERTHFGDADLNGTVDFADFLALSENFGTAGGWRRGDFDGNQKVDFPDFLLLSENFGQTGSAITSVPEPSSLNVFLLALFGLSIPKLRRHMLDHFRWLSEYSFFKQSNPV